MITTLAGIRLEWDLRDVPLGKLDLLLKPIHAHRIGHISGFRVYLTKQPDY